MPRYKLIVEYDGAAFSGWQAQPDARTVEGELEQAFARILQQPVDLIGQGRTDAGVHARGQVAHVDLPNAVTDVEVLRHGVNGLSGPEIVVHAMEEVHDDFHARFDALSRTYSYTLFKEYSPIHRNTAWFLPGGCNIALLRKCAALINGEFDFAGFSKYNVENFTTLCTVEESFFHEDDEKLIYFITANRFLRNMVRRIVGTMIKTAEGKLGLGDFGLLLKNPDADILTFTAPAQGLVLERVSYKNLSE